MAESIAVSRATLMRLDQELEALEDDERFRPSPDRSRIEKWTITTHEHVWQQLANELNP